MEHWELCARETIRSLIAAYNYHGDGGRFNELIALFAPNAVMVSRGNTFQGHAEIMRIFTSARSRMQNSQSSFLQHHTSTHHIEILTPNKARSRSYYSVYMTHGIDHWGRYHDEFGLIDGKWLFTHRRATLDGQGGNSPLVSKPAGEM